MTKEVNFTKTFINSIRTPKKGRVSYRDTKEKGLSLYITKSGTRTFFLRRRINGKDERVILGRFPDMSVEEARKKALVAKAEIAAGKNPNEEKKKIRDDYTFKELFDLYIEDYAKLNTKSWQSDIEDINRNLSHWFRRKISTISTEEIRKLHTIFGRDRGIYGANRLLDRINAVYNKAIEWGWDGNNPAKGIKKFKMKSRDRFLQADELPRLFKALSEEENIIARDYILMSLLTGARKSNVLAMCWKDINFHTETWRIPDTKNGEPVIIPLTKQAIEILNQRKSESNESEFVFPGTGKSGHLSDPKKSWHRVLKRAEIKDLRIHDLRRTLASWQACMGVSSAIIGKSLGHKSRQATAIYERLNIDPVRDSVGKATDAMFAILNEEETV